VALLAACVGAVMFISGGVATAMPLGGPPNPPPPSGTSAPITYQPALHSAAYSNPGVLSYGDAVNYGAPTRTTVPSPVVAMAPTANGKGYWLVTADGKVYAYGNAVHYGDVSAVNLYAPIVGITPTPDGAGYWLYALDGGIFSFGDARFHGSTGGIKLWQPIVGMAPTSTGQGYWMVASDGGVFAFGDARFFGSTGGVKLASPIVGMVAAKDGDGYLMAGGDGGVFSFGHTHFEGSLGGHSISGWINSIAGTESGNGYWLANANGAVYSFGDAAFHGNDLVQPAAQPIVQIVATPDSGGYWLLEPDAFPTDFSHPTSSHSPIVALASSQVEGDPSSGYFCNPYGPCEAWCALFVTWVWSHSGVPVGSIAFVGNIWAWAASHTHVLSPSATPSPGDAVLYGTGPQNVNTAVHTGIVAQVWPDGAIDTIEGDAGPAQTGYLAVVINGPFLPSHSDFYNGFPIFGYAVP
jgi:hypothetical protein